MNEMNFKEVQNLYFNSGRAYTQVQLAIWSILAGNRQKALQQLSEAKALLDVETIGTDHHPIMEERVCQN